jgi:uncharacterized cysteine cluster protein YcgN (CxxCxxCC family)
VKALEPAKLVSTPVSAEQLSADTARAKDYSRRKVCAHAVVKAARACERWLPAPQPC